MTVRGRLHGKRIDLDVSVDEIDGDVEVVVRPLPRPTPTVARMVKLISSFPRAPERVCQRAPDTKGFRH